MQSGLFPGREHPGDIVMIQSGSCLSFILETLNGHTVERQRRGQHLERHLALESLVGSQENASHPTHSDTLLDRKVTDADAGNVLGVVSRRKKTTNQIFLKNRNLRRRSRRRSPPRIRNHRFWTRAFVGTPPKTKARTPG